MFRTGRDLVHRAFEAANNSGDLTFAGVLRRPPQQRTFSRRAIRSMRCKAKAERGLALCAKRSGFGLAIDLIAATARAHSDAPRIDREFRLL